MTASLTRLFGVQNLALVEDVVQDAFARALEVWRLNGPPPNPSAWLMATARNRALDVIRRERTARRFAPSLTRLLESEWTARAVVDEAFSSDIVLSAQLRMMFSCCDPELSEPAQIALILNILCGFGVGEIAAAFLEGRAAVEKRIARGRRTLAQSARLFDLSQADLEARRSAVHRALYLLFNEGYHGASTKDAVRVDLCNEAMRLAALLREHPATRTPATFALSALMALNAARLPSRLDESGDLQPLLEQDRSTWNQALIAEGRRLLEESATGDEVSSYHLEASIAAMHSSAPSLMETNWNTIVMLYDRLLEVAPSAVVELNRAIAIAQRDGPDRGLEAIDGIADRDRLETYPFYHAALGHLEQQRGNGAAARRHLERALGMARSDAERRFLARRLGETAPT
jgi:RNA polymerase sigma-70 factor (ECF subfamily)